MAARVRMATGPSGMGAAELGSGLAPPHAPCDWTGSSRTVYVSAASARQRAGTSDSARKASSADSSSHTANIAHRRRSALSVIVSPRPVPSRRQKRSPATRRSSGRSRPIRDNPSGAVARR